MQCILADRLYVPDIYVKPEHLNEFVYDIEEQGSYDYGSFQTTTGSIRTFSKVSLGGKTYYGFSRGNMEKLGRLFGDLPWLDKTSAPRMTSALQFKGQLHTWQSKKIGQQEAVDSWLKYKCGIIKAPPRFGKCCTGDTIIHTTERGSIPLKSLFDAEHPDGDLRAKELELATKDGLFFTAGIYKKTVDTTVAIKTSRGFSIEGTPNHPLYVKSEAGFEWKTMDSIVVGDKIALQANTNVFTTKSTVHYKLYAKYILLNRKYSERLLLRLMTFSKEVQQLFINEISHEGEITSDNRDVLKLCQVMLLNLGFMSRLEE